MGEEKTTGALGGADRALLYGTGATTGAAVMMLELLGTRIIGPFYGVSLYVWSSLISVALIALSLGYYLGGVIADRETGFRLSYAIALAGLTAALIPFISRPVLLWTDDLGMRGGAFASALLLFTAPLTLLGMVGPQVIKMATVRREEALEVRSEGTRLEREMKADRVAKAERVFKYQHECDVAEMEAKHRESHCKHSQPPAELAL